MQPRVLIVSACEWLATARLALALRECGCTVMAVLPPRHPLRAVNADVDLHIRRASAGGRAVASAIADFRPDLVIPGDDHATSHLHALHASAGAAGNVLTVDLLERSLGPPSSYKVARSRFDLLELAAAEGVRVPPTGRVTTDADVEAWGRRHGFPAVLKLDGTFSAGGVRVARSPAEATAALASLKAPRSLPRALARAVLDRDPAPLRERLRARPRGISMQRYVDGHDANVAVACWQGRVLASIAVDVLHTRVSRGPSSLIERVEAPSMVRAARALCARLSLTGLYGFDFVVDRVTGEAVLIEMNPRATQTCHLALGPGRDLPAALVAALSGAPEAPRPTVTRATRIALFPQELQRDPTGAALASAYHDVPWNELGLVRQALAETARLRHRAGAR